MASKGVHVLNLPHAYATTDDGGIMDTPLVDALPELARELGGTLPCFVKSTMTDKDTP